MELGKFITSKHIHRRAIESSYFSVRATNANRQSSGTTSNGFGTATNTTDSISNLTSFATANTSGSFAGLESTSLDEIPVNSDAEFHCVIKTSADITIQRIWVGFIENTLSNTDNQTGVNICFRYSTVAGDTGWRAIVDDGTTQTISSNIGTITANTYYYLKIRVDFSNGKYFSQ